WIYLNDVKCLVPTQPFISSRWHFSHFSGPTAVGSAWAGACAAARTNAKTASAASRIIPDNPLFFAQLDRHEHSCLSPSLCTGGLPEGPNPLLLLIKTTVSQSDGF